MAKEPYHVTPCLVASLATIHPSNLASGFRVPGPHSINRVLNPCRVGPLGGLRVMLIEQHFRLFGLPLGARSIPRPPQISHSFCFPDPKYPYPNS